MLVNAPRNELIDQANVPTKRGNRPQLFGIRFLPTLECADSVYVSNSAQSWRHWFIERAKCRSVGLTRLMVRTKVFFQHPQLRVHWMKSDSLGL